MCSMGTRQCSISARLTTAIQAFLIIKVLALWAFIIVYSIYNNEYKYIVQGPELRLAVALPMSEIWAVLLSDHRKPMRLRTQVDCIGFC